MIESELYDGESQKNKMRVSDVYDECVGCV